MKEGGEESENEVENSWYDFNRMCMISNSYKWRKTSPAVLPLSFSLPSSTALISSALIRLRTKGMWYPSVEWSPITPSPYQQKPWRLTNRSNQCYHNPYTQPHWNTNMFNTPERVWGFQRMSYCICNRSFHMHFSRVIPQTSQTQLLHMEGRKGQNPLNRAYEIWPFQHALIVRVNTAILYEFLLYL